MKQFDFPSSSSPKTYHTLINDNGLLSCDCPGWTVKKEGKPRFCKHCKNVQADEGLTLEERDGQMFIVKGAGKVLPGDQPVPTPSTSRYVQHSGNVSGAATTEGVQSSSATPPTSIKSPKPASEVKDALNKLQEVTDEQTAEDLKKAGFITPMLASAMPEGKTADSYATADYVLEEKFDGHRIIVRVSGDNPTSRICAWSRLGNVRTLPKHIHDLMWDMPVGVYDGELIVPSSQHSYRVTAGQSTGEEALVLFDMIEVDGKPIANCQQHVRRAFLQIAMGALDVQGMTVFVAAQHIPSLAKVQEIWQRGGEGAIIKKQSGKYNPGWRSPDWVKVKAIANATLEIIGFEVGKNGPYSVVKLRDKDGIETTVKTLDNQTMRAFATNPDSYIGKRLVISYQEKMPSGKYRHPMFDHFAGVGE